MYDGYLAESRRARLVLGVGALVALMAACVPHDPSSEQPRQPTVRVSPEIKLPLDAYKMSRRELAIYDTAVDVITQGCMRARGFDWWIPDRTRVRPSFNVRRYGVIDLEVAGKFGYHLPSDPVSQALQRRDANLSEELRSAAVGSDGSEGCLQTAAERLGIDVPDADYALVADLDFKSLDMSVADDAMMRSNTAWHTCMSGAGYPKYESPNDAISDERWNLDSPTIPKLEVEVATSDVRCKLKVGMIDTWLAVETQVQENMIARHSTALAVVAAANRRSLANALDVIARAGAQNLAPR